MEKGALRIFIGLLCLCQLNLSVFAQSKKVDSLEVELSKATVDTLKASIMAKIAWEIKASEPERAKELAEKILELSLKTKYEVTEAAAYNQLGVYYYLKHDDKPARQYFEKALQLYKKLNNIKGVASCYSNMSNLFSNVAAFDSALIFQNEALKYRLKLGQEKPIADSYLNLGNIYNLKGDYTASIGNIFKALKMYEKINDGVGLGLSYYNIGRTYYMQGRNNEAIMYAKKSREEREKLLDASGVATTFILEASSLEQLKRYTEAAQVINKAIVIQKEMNDFYNLQYSYSILANIFYGYHQLDLSLEYYLKSLELSIQTNNTQGVIGMKYNIGAIYSEKKDFKKALEYELDAIEMAKKVGAKEELKKGYYNLQQNYARMGDFTKAYEYMNAFMQLKDTLLSESNVAQLNELQAKYETDKKQKEIELFKKTDEVQKEKIARQSIVTYTVVGGLILVLVLAFISFKRYREKQRANVEITHQKEIIEEKNKEIVDSIQYAKRIQRALLASDNLLKNNLPEYFVLYKPKDIVSGDFYWATSASNGNFMLATCDCTGHGVPGAFMSLLNMTKLNETINEKKILTPNLVLNDVRTEIIKALNPDGVETVSKDGMDAVLCSYDFKQMKLEFAAANNPVVIIRNNEIIEFKPDKFPVGLHQGEESSFTLQAVQLQKGDCVYTFTDGYSDQFGGPKGKKFMSKNFKEILRKLSSGPMSAQKKELETVFEEWRANYEQVDDVCVIGVRI